MAVHQIAFAIPELDRGGPDRVFFELLRGLDRSRFSPQLITSASEGHYLRQLPGDVDIVVLPPRHPRLDRYPVADLARVLAKRKPALVMSTLRMNLTLGLSPYIPRGTRSVIRQANDVTANFDEMIGGAAIKHRVTRMMLIAALRRVDAVVCQSMAMRRDVEQVTGRKHHLFAISNPIDVAYANALVTPLPVDQRPQGAPALISVGRLMPQKGYDVLLPALAQVRKQFPGVHLTIIGDGPDKQALVNQCEHLAITSNVTFAGYRNDVLSMVAASDLFVLASRYEGFPNAALEALAIGIPVVLTDCPGANAELVQLGRNGRLARSITPDAVAVAMREAMAELGSYDKPRMIADTNERYGASVIVDRYQQMFTQVITGSAAE